MFAPGLANTSPAFQAPPVSLCAHPQPRLCLCVMQGDKYKVDEEKGDDDAGAGGDGDDTPKDDD